MPVERGHPGHDIWDRNTRTRQLGQDIWERTIRTGQSQQDSGQVSWERTEMTGLPGHDSGVRRAMVNVAWAGHLEQEDS
jgi:hypothetical protein